MEYTKDIERTFQLPAGALLRVSNRRGELVVRGEDREDVAVTAQIRLEAMNRNSADERFDAFELPMQESEGRLEIGPPRYDDPNPVVFGFSLSRFMKGPKLDLLIRVPKKINLEAENGTGQLTVEGIEGPSRLAARRGRIQASDLSGDVRIDARNGRVEVRSVNGSLELAARNGRVEIEEITGSLEVKTRTGRITVKNVNGPCRVETRTGKVVVSDVDGPLDLTTQTGAVEYHGRMIHDANINVRTGMVTLAITRDSAFFIDAEARTGKVMADLPVNYLEEPPEDAATVRIRTRTGAIRIVPA
jgi:hypothetical protein